jgi:cysteine desulfurase
MPDKPIYLDNNSTTRVDPRVVEKMLPFFTEDYGNASSVTHEYGIAASNAVTRARKQVADLLQCDPKCLIFTSGATEANNLAIFGVMRASTHRGRHLIVNAAEHKAVLDPAARLRDEGYEVTVLPVDPLGAVRIEDLNVAIRDDTVLVSVMHANNEVGTLNAIERIARVCQRAGVLLHTDASQSVGKLRFDVNELGVDLLSLSAHKLYGPKGVGALFIRPGFPKNQIAPLVEGGGHERKLRSGTLPVHQIIGFGEACEICDANLEAETGRIATLRELLKNMLSERVADLHFNGNAAFQLPGMLHLSIPGANAEAIMMKLRHKLAISSGSACTTTSPEPSHVLKAMGIPTSLLSCCLRIGIGRFTTEDEIRSAAELLSDAIRTTRELSGYKVSQKIGT